MLRELRESDAEEVAALFQTVYGDERPIDAEEIVSWVNNAELKPEWLRVLELDGRVVGYGDIMIEDDEVALDVAASVGHWDTFFEWAEEQARAADAGRVRLYFPAGHHTEDLARDRGYRLWRSSYTMNIDLGDEPPDKPPPPNGITFRPYRPEDEDRLRAAVNEAFANDPFFHEETPERFRDSISERAASTQRSGCSRGTDRSSRASCLRFWSASASPISVGRVARRARALAPARPGRRAAAIGDRRAARQRPATRGPRCRRRERDWRFEALRACRHGSRPPGQQLGARPVVASRQRADRPRTRAARAA